MKPVNLVFLDVDGVLNPVDSTHEHAFEPGCVENLKFILASVPNTRIVLSTSWRCDFSLFRLGWYWRHHGFDNELVLGGTPELGSADGSEVRGQEILQWFNGRTLAVTGLSVHRYAVLEDETEQLRDDIPPSNIFQCEPHLGLTRPIAQAVVHFFLTGERMVADSNSEHGGRRP